MARKLNTRLLLKVLIFVGVPAAIFVWAFSSGWLSAGDPQELYEKALQYFEQEEYNQAWIAIRNSAKAGGNKDPKIMFLLGQIAMKQEPPAVGQALQAYKAVVSMQPDHVEAQRNLAELYVAVRYWEEARVEIKRLKELDPSFGKAYLWGGHVEMALAAAEPIQARKVPYYEAAADSCLQGIDKAPDELPLYWLLAQVYTQMEQDEKVEEVISLAVANNPTSADAYILKATRLIALDRSDEARKVLELAVEKAGRSARLYIALGEVATKENDIDAARQHFADAVAADPKEATAYLRLAGIHRVEGNRDKAVEVLDKGLKELPDSATLLAQLADLCIEMNNRERADQLIAQLEEMVTRPGVVEYLKGKRAVVRRQLRQAITYLEQARDKQVGPQSQLLLGRAYLAAEELGAAQRELQDLVASHPRLTPAWRDLAQVQLRLRNFDKAGRSARVVLQANPGDIKMRLLLAQTLMLRNRPNDALTEATTAAQHAKDDPDPHLMMAEILQKQNRNAEAEAMYRRAVAVATSEDLVRVYRRFLAFYGGTKQQTKQKALIEEMKKALPEDARILADTPAEVEKELLQRVADNAASMSDRLALARLYEVTGRADEAKEGFTQVLAKAEAGSREWRQAWQRLFLSELGAGKYEEAAVLIGRLKEAEPNAPELLFADPLIRLGRNELDEALTLLRAVLAKHKTLSHGHFLIGQVLARQRKYDEAMVALGKALEARPNLIAARLLLGRIYYSRGNYAGAKTEADETLRFSPRLVPALEMKAAAQAGLGDWSGALKTREEVAAVVPTNTRNLIALATLHVQQHDPAKAEEVFKRAYQQAPDDALLVRTFADFYADTKRAQLGEKIIDGYVGKHPDNLAAQLARAQFTAKVAGPAEAEVYFRKAAELAPDDPYPLVFLGDQYSRLGQWAKAAEIYREAVGRAKDNTIPKKRLADVYMLQGNTDEAKAVINTVLSDTPTDVAALVVAGRIAARQDKEDEAKQFMERALALRPDYGEAKVRLAEIYAGPNPMRALDLLDDVDPSDTSFEKAMLLRADINTRRVQLTNAILDLRRLLDFRPTSIPARMQLAAKYMANREPDRAAELLRQLSRERLDQDTAVLGALGDALMRSGKPEDALAAYEKARSVQPENADALTGEVRCLVSLGRKDEAMKRTRRAMDQWTNEIWPRLALVALYEQTGELDKAFDVLRTTLLPNPKWERGYVYLADLLVRAKQIDEARKILLTGLSKVPKSIPIRAGLAALDIGDKGSEIAVKILKPLAEEFEAEYSRMPDKLGKLRPYLKSIRIYSLALYNLGRTDEALKWGMMLWLLDPTDVANANNMAWILATEHKDLVRARDMIQRCMRLVPNHPQVLDTAGWIAFLGNRYEEAVDNLMASIKYGDNPEAHYHLGRVYEARQRPDEARAELKKALELGLNDPKAKADAEQRLKQLASAP